MEAPERIYWQRTGPDTGFGFFVPDTDRTEYIRADLVADLVAEGNRMEAETDELKAQLAAKDAELSKMKTKLEESTRVLADCEGNESNSYGMVTRQIIENSAMLEQANNG